jgi:hypothetical protein
MPVAADARVKGVFFYLRVKGVEENRSGIFFRWGSAVLTGLSRWVTDYRKIF